MSDFQITGISSGIDWGSIIDTMMESKRAVETQWYEEQEKLDIKALLYEELAANLSRLQGSLDPLKRESTFLSKSVAVTPTAGTTEPVTVTASPEAEIARFNIDVISVASNHRVAGNRYDDADAALGLEGSFDLSLGDFTVTVDVSSDQSLKDVAATVNAAVTGGGDRPAPVGSGPGQHPHSRGKADGVRKRAFRDRHGRSFGDPGHRRLDRQFHQSPPGTCRCADYPGRP
jgi:flagellar hook-associated protein 2